jgi:dihydroorotate dehydrogenase
LEEINEIENNRHYSSYILKKRTLTCIASRCGNRLHRLTRADVVKFECMFPSRLEAAKPSRMSLYPFVRPFVFAFDAERAHRLSLSALRLFGAHRPPVTSSILSSQVAGLHFPNPVGLAAGYDKDAEVPLEMLGTGFGFVEVGTLTPLPQAGNPQPRLFRLVEDRAVINRMGFNNGGQAAALPRLQASQGRGLIGVNIGANKDAVDRIADYATGVRQMAPVASYLTVNISSPNTPGLRALQDEGALSALLDGVLEARGNLDVPVFLKLAPDLEPTDIDSICRIALDRKLAALIITNTTIARPALQSSHAGEAGGLSGAPLRALALQRLRDFRRASGGAIPLVGVGGISTVDDAWNRIRAGASLIQIYSALVYEGPGLVRRIVRGLEKKVREEGFNSIAEAVGNE